MTINVNVKLGVLEHARIDFTEQMEHCADLIAQEMRGNVKAGLDVKGVPLTPNKEPYATRKMKTLGHTRPLIAKERALVTPSWYSIKRMGMNFVRIGFVGVHPGSGGLTTGQIAYIHNFGLGKNPVRQFAGVTSTAVKRIMAYMNTELVRHFK